MNRFAYHLTGLAIQTLSKLSKARINIHGKKNIPKGPSIFVINHFTRIETLILPNIIYRITEVPVWSLADYGLFKGALGALLDKIGAVSTKNPDRDLLIVKTLLTKEASWIIYPEGRMVKNKKIIEKGRFLISYAGGKHPPHSGAAALALRTEFYRQRLLLMRDIAPDEAERLLNLFRIDSIESVSDDKIYIVPVNITYYPIRAVENIISKIAGYLIEDINTRMIEEIMTEGTMLLSGVDMDIRFGEPIEISRFMRDSAICQDISSKKRIDFDDKLESLGVMKKRALDIMKRYMAAIYGMTTVNHDHLFASILKLSPYKSIDQGDFRRRVFMAATGNLDKMGIHLHTSLKTDQLHLITDDRHNKYKDFISIAKEKNVVEEKDNILEKNTDRFSVALKDALSQGHTVRIDNPIAVIANEVEPLSSLQKSLRFLSWQPGFMVRRKIAKRLMKKAVFDFENDYKAFYVEGKSKDKCVGMPFLSKGRSGRTGVVLIHGYMAAPLEVKKLAEYLSRKGLWVYVPRLKGHGTSPEDLANRSFAEWIESVDEGYAVINNLCKEVVVGGFSSGAGLALDLAARVKGIKGVFAVCPPLRLQDFSAKLIPAVDGWNRLMKMVHIDRARKEFIENSPENPHINYIRNPISGVRELEKLMDALSPKLPGISAPALVIQAQNDPVVDPRGSKMIFELLGTDKKEYMIFNYDRHGILLGDGADRVYKAIADFVEYL